MPQTIDSTLLHLIEYLTPAQAENLVQAIGIISTFSHGYGTVRVEIKNNTVYRIGFEGDIREPKSPIEKQ